MKQNESSQSTDPGDQEQTDSKADVVSQNQDQKKDEDSKETQKPSTEADSQKSETQNVDADKSEDTQEPSKEQEKVLYDITFDTPEKHGRVTDLDGKEVADGKTLKTDENGKTKFKVKPDDGYQVQAVYQMPDEQTPLKLVKDSYYEMQVEKNTTVKVVYQKIPAKDGSEDAGEDDSQKAPVTKGEMKVVSARSRDAIRGGSGTSKDPYTLDITKADTIFTISAGNVDAKNPVNPTFSNEQDYDVIWYAVVNAQGKDTFVVGYGFRDLGIKVGEMVLLEDFLKGNPNFEAYETQTVGTFAMGPTGIKQMWQYINYNSTTYSYNAEIYLDNILYSTTKIEKFNAKIIPNQEPYSLAIENNGKEYKFDHMETVPEGAIDQERDVQGLTIKYYYISETPKPEANVSIENWTYDGKFDAKKSLKATSESDGNLSYTYYKKSGNDWEKLEKGPIDAGDYKVVASWAETESWAAVSAERKFTINPREIELTAKSDEKAYDGTALTNSGYDITKGSFVEGEGLKSVTVEGSQTLVGEGKNTITGYELNDKTKAKNYTITTKEGKLKVTDREEGQELKIEVKANSKTAEYNGSEQSVSGLEKTTFEVNGVTYTVEGLSAEAKGTDAGSYPSEVTGTAKVLDAEKNDVTKQFQVTKVNGELKVNSREIELTTENATKTYDGTPLTAGGTVEGIVLGESYGFKLTGSQTLVGSSRNTYELTWAEEGNDYTAKASNYYMTKETLGTLTVTDGSEEEPINPEDVVKKTHGTPEGGVYKAGDVVTFTVTATNIYDEVKTITLNEIAGVTLKDTVFADVQPGETVETTATYTITEADVLAGEFVNTVTASFSGEEDTPFEDDDQVDEIEEPKGHLTIDKVTTSEPANGSSYALGETITYKITATNDGNLTLTNVKVVDELTGDEWEIASLAPGASEEFDTSYTVTEADILAGSVVNTATAEGTSPDPDKPDVPVNPGEEEEPTETEKPSLFVEKTAQPDEDGVYNLGDEIHYVIKVTNNGNVTVNDITVKDELTGDEWQLDSLTPGESEEYHATYTVTEEDILAGSITNVATAEGTDPDEDPVDQEGEETVPTDSADSHLTIHKATTSDPGEDGVYDLGDTITYEIIAANDGNVTLNNVVVTDELTGDEWIIETLAPGVSETFEAEYVVTEEDIHNGSVVNEATATAEGPEEPVITPGETEDETNPENPSLTVDKSIVEEKDEYEIGDVIEYEITVANNGNVTQNDVRVTDLLQAAGDIVITGVEGADGEIDGAIVTLDSLAPGESATIHCEYTVLKEDRGSTITNAAIADDEGKGDGEDPVTPDVPAEVADVYDINVVHQFADGEEGEAELPDDYTIENQPVGTEKEITAETVEGYAVSPASQEVTIEDSDVTITFVYYTDEIGTDPENPDTPDNVPDRYQAVVTFEAVNGTVDRSTAVVTLMRSGQPAEDGTGYLTEDQIATARANVGYAQNSLTWSPGTPTAEYKVTGDMTFTASFSAIPVIPGDGGEEPVEPTNPTTPTTPARPSTPTTPTLPVTPANPGTTVTPTLPVTPQTAAPAARVYADGVVVDDPQTATDDYDLNEVERDAGTETIDEDSTPLGNMDLEKDDDHKCCILHFILLLLALIVELIYTHDRKKRQERIFELRRELADFDETV